MENKSIIKNHVVSYFMDLYKDPMFLRPILDRMEFKMFFDDQRE